MKKLIGIIVGIILLMTIAWSQTPTLERDAAGYPLSTLESAKYDVDDNGIVTVRTMANPGFTTIADGRKFVTTAGTAVALASTTTTCKKVEITAEFNNTGVIVVGGSTVVADLATRRGTPLYAGSTYTLVIDNLTDIYIDATVSTDGVTFTYYR